MTPGKSRRRRDAAAQRVRRRRAISAGVLALAIVALAFVLALSRPSGHGSAAGATRAKTHSGVVAHPAPRLSPAGLTLGKPRLALTGIGNPQADTVHIAFHRPPRAGLLFDLSTGRVLWQRNALARARIASLTKMMTALLTVESEPPNARVLVTKEAVETDGSKVGELPIGRHVLLETMLYGLLLPSGNDAAVALAQHVAGSVGGFVARMNAQAAALGLGCTRYSSPSGYFDQGNFSCAADLAELARVDLEQPRIARVARTYAAALPFPIRGGRLFLYNNNPLLIYHYPGLTGLKTGYTIAAGRCLVATAKRHGVSLGVVLLHSPAPGKQASQLLDRAFQGIYHQAPVAGPAIPPEA
jgi:serine-type D-Ala-D-Ala carboxypeptidase (penicillin-binding protein 5/6)